MNPFRVNPFGNGSAAIHIIVKAGRVTLEGVVGTDADKTIANVQAGAVPGVLSVTNHLVVQMVVQTSQ